MANSSSSIKLQTLSAHCDGVNVAKLGARSGQVLATGGEDGKINLWRIGRPACLLSIKAAKSGVKALCFDAEERIVAGGSTSGSIQMFSLDADGKSRCRLSGHRAECTSLSVHPLGNLVLSGSVDATVKLWDVRSKGCVRTLMGHSDSINCADFSPDGRWAVSGSADKTVRLWDLQNGKILHEFSSRGVVSATGFHPDEFWLATASTDGTVKYFDLETFRLVGSTPTDGHAHLRSIHFLARRQEQENSAANRVHKHSLVAATDEGVKLWRWNPCRCIGSENAQWGRLADSQISRDKNGDDRLITCNFKEKSLVTIWSMNLSQLANGRDGDESEQTEKHNACGVARSPLNGSRKPQQDDAYAMDFESDSDSGEANSSRDASSRSCTAPPKGIKSLALEKLDERVEHDAGKVKGEEDKVVESQRAISARKMAGKAPKAVECREDIPPKSARNSREESSAESKQSDPTLHNKEGGVAKAAPKSSRDHLLESKEQSAVEHDEAKTATPSAKDKLPSRRSLPPVERVVQEDSTKAPGSSRGSHSARGVKAGERAERDEALIQKQLQIFGPFAARDSPLDMSISEFFQRPSAEAVGSERAVRAEMKVNLADEVLAGHSRFIALMQERGEELDHVVGLWHSGQHVATLDYLEQLGNAAISFDFFKLANLKNGQSASLDICSVALPTLEGLAASPFEDHIKVSLATVKFLFDSFADIVRSTVEHHKRHARAGAVDISREERVGKCNACLEGFRSYRNMLRTTIEQQSSMAESSRTRREMELLTDRLDKYLAGFDE